MKKIMFNDKYGLTKAVLQREKTQTRRICREKYWAYSDIVNVENGVFHFENPCYRIGEIVAIAQKYEDIYNESGLETMDMLIQGMKYSKGWTNKMFVRADLMPYQIRITKVRIQRLQDISDDDCIKEGVYKDFRDDKIPPSIFYDFEGNENDGFDTLREAYAALIDKISGKGTWESNPYVWVYDFELIK